MKCKLFRKGQVIAAGIKNNIANLTCQIIAAGIKNNIANLTSQIINNFEKN